MRTLKKTLCLVLALAMILGLGAFSVSATSLKDDADVGVDYREAVEVLTTVGALKGDDKGNLNPKEEMTRAEAAILIARLSKVSEEAGIAPFDDCTDYNSFAGGAIAYCFYQGLINGDGNGNYMPGQPLTGYAFEKMLLCALGYDAQIESLTNVGETWTIATAALAKKAGISWSSLDASKNLTREVAAKLVLNALKADMVEYANRGVTVNNADGSSVRVANSPATKVYSTADYSSAIDGTAGAANVVQLGEDLYSGDLKRDNAAVTDDYGRPASKWSYNNKDIITASSTPYVTFTSKTNAADVATALNGYKIYVGTTEYAVNNTDNRTGSLYSKNDGATRVLYTTAKGEDDITLANQTIAAGIAALTENGRLVEVYTSNSTGRITKITQVEYTVEKVSAINTNTAGDVTYSFSVSGAKTDFANGDDTVILHGTIAKDDYVTTTHGYNKNVLDVYPTTIVTGQQTSVSGSKVTISGATYTLGTGVRTNGLAGAGTYVSSNGWDNSTTDANYYIDQYGYAVNHSKLSTSKNYAAVVAIQASEAGISSTKVRVQARLAFSDGTVSTGYVSKINTLSASKVVTNSNTADADTNIKSTDSVSAVNMSTKMAGNTNLSNRIVSYVSTSDGYELTYGYDYNNGTELKATLTGDGKELITKGYAQIGRDSAVAGNKTGVANAATAYVVRTESDTYKAYTGFANVPTIKAGTGTVSVRWVNNDSGKAEFVYIDAQNGTSSDKSTGNVMYMFDNNNGITTTGVGSDALYTLRGVLNGTLDEAITSTSSTFSLDSGKPEGGNFYKVELDKSNNRVTGGALATWDSTGIVTVENLDEIADNVFASRLVDSNSTIYVITDTSSDQSVVKAENLASAGISVGDSYQLDVNSDGSSTAKNTIDVLYIVKGATNGAVEAASGDSTTAKEQNTTTLQDAVETGNVVYGDVIATSDTTKVTVTDGKTLTVQGTLDVGNAGLDVQGTLDLYGDIKAGTITVEKGGTLNITTTATKNEITGHIDAAPGSTVNIVASDGVSINGSSLVVCGGATASITAKTVNIKGLVRAYTVSSDTGAAKITITADDVVISGNGSLQGEYSTGKDVQIAINGNLTVANATGSDATTGTGTAISLVGAAKLTVSGKFTVPSNITSTLVSIDSTAVFTAGSVFKGSTLNESGTAYTDATEVTYGASIGSGLTVDNENPHGIK